MKKALKSGETPRYVLRFEFLISVKILMSENNFMIIVKDMEMEFSRIRFVLLLVYCILQKKMHLQGTYSKHFQNWNIIFNTRLKYPQRLIFWSIIWSKLNVLDIYPLCQELVMQHKGSGITLPSRDTTDLTTIINEFVKIMCRRSKLIKQNLRCSIFLRTQSTH